jgi:hypothetical protein
MWGQDRAHVRPDRIEDTWPYPRAGAFADSKCGTIAGSRPSFEADAGFEAKATQSATLTFDASMAQEPRAEARDAAHSTTARCISPELPAKQSKYVGQLGPRFRSRAGLPPALQDPRLAALSLEYARQGAPGPDGKEEALRLAQSAPTPRVPHSWCAQTLRAGYEHET